MALLVVCGQPSCGKSGIVEKLAAAMRQLCLTVIVVDEPSLHLSRNDSYKSAAAEKQVRAKLKSAVERALSKKTYVILDSLNNIKGYRYELWCVARSSGCRYCMIHVHADLEVCKRWNLDRDGDKYSEEIFDDLAGRFERPDARNRWDAPLFTVHPDVRSNNLHSQEHPEPLPPLSSQHLNQAESSSPTPFHHSGHPTRLQVVEASNAVRASTCRMNEDKSVSPSSSGATTCIVNDAGFNAENSGIFSGNLNSQHVDKFKLHAERNLEVVAHDDPCGPHEGGEDVLLPWDEGSPSGETEELAAIIAAMVEGGAGVAGTAGMVLQQQAQLKPTFATSGVQMFGTNTLHEIDKATQEVVNTINEAQMAAAGSGPGIVRFTSGLQPLRLDQTVTLAELRRHKRAFLKLATKILFARLQDKDTAARMFIDYLKDNISGASLVIKD
ncbi:hypothetical protein CEUSTIGMA_g2350.t1 [Chlamydomonas eustigma]|uniref:Protein KTI12 homolog n=1 Tax=Chlamydomonas eustigma TaxID=1157962 RepID=A0A250WVN8_9CHLO|nr:hypothetical protein CEUSTIGMA_g2350.t1 [Chlamydomonas eustigma]|eukprot:GAX74904.1 hypothetical protein CEUSTIGMA_g2350.t1 [Chlamydomonas eustigma]